MRQPACGRGVRGVLVRGAVALGVAVLAAALTGAGSAEAASKVPPPGVKVSSADAARPAHAGGAVNATSVTSRAGVVQSSGVGSSEVRADFNGDGVEDLALFYDYGYGNVALWTMNGTRGALQPPAWRWGSGNWGSGTRFLSAGDFNGDGKADIALFYDYGYGHVAPFTFTAHSNGDGGFDGPSYRWDAPSWGGGTRFMTAGDYNGDHVDDIALFYDYGNGHVTLFTLTGDRSGNLTSLTGRWDAPSWGGGTRFMATGNFNHDAADDIALFYDYGYGRVALFTLTGDSYGNLTSLASRWNAPTWGGGTKFMTVGDYNGDHVDDIALFYDWGDGEVGMFYLYGNGDGSVDGAWFHWYSPYWGSGTRFMAAGDYNGDGLDEIALFYDYGNGHVALINLIAQHLYDYNAWTQWDAPHWGGGTRAMF